MAIEPTVTFPSFRATRWRSPVESIQGKLGKDQLAVPKQEAQLRLDLWQKTRDIRVPGFSN
jgi:hypothetical protein